MSMKLVSHTKGRTQIDGAEENILTKWEK